MRAIRSKLNGFFTACPPASVIRRVRERLFQESPFLRRKDVGGELVLDAEHSPRGIAILNQEMARWQARQPRSLGNVARARLAQAETQP